MRALVLLTAAGAVALGGCRSAFVRQAKVADHPSVVALYAESGLRRRHVGTAFLAAPGRLVTAHHVARGAAFEGAPAEIPDLVAESEDGTRRRIVGVRGDSPERDLIALVVEDADDVPLARLAEAAPWVGAPVAVVGYGGGGLRVVTGRVVTREEEGDPALDGYFTASCPVIGGHSGSPLFDAEGAVVGVAVRGKDSVLAQRAANVLPLLDAPARMWEVWCLAERASPKEQAGNQIDQASISSATEDVSRLERALARWRNARDLCGDEETLESSFEGECGCLAKLGRPEESVAALRARLKDRPDCAWAERLLGHYLLACEDVEGYVHLRRATALDPTNVTADVEHANWSYHVKPAPDPVPGLRRVVALAPGWAHPWALLGSLASRRGDHEEAARAWRAVTEIRPDHAAAFSGYANALYGLGRWEEAREAAEAALRRDPKSSSSRQVLVVALFQLGEGDAARRALEDLRAVAPDEARLLDPYAAKFVVGGR